MIEQDYSKLKLSPNSKDEKKKFLMFRVDDVSLNFKYIMILASCECVFVLLNEIYSLVISVNTDSG